jgi:hypothetical protein
LKQHPSHGTFVEELIGVQGARAPAPLRAAAADWRIERARLPVEPRK